MQEKSGFTDTGINSANKRSRTQEDMIASDESNAIASLENAVLAANRSEVALLFRSKPNARPIITDEHLLRLLDKIFLDYKVNLDKAQGDISIDPKAFIALNLLLTTYNNPNSESAVIQACKLKQADALRILFYDNQDHQTIPPDILNEVLANFHNINNSALKCGDTPLMIAAGFGNMDAATLLLSWGANATALSPYGKAPIHRAAAAGHANLLELLLSAGANVDMPDNGQATPMHLACKRGRHEVVSLLLELKADLEAKDALSNQPIDYAIRAYQMDYVIGRTEDTLSVMRALVLSDGKFDLETIRKVLPKAQEKGDGLLDTLREKFPDLFPGANEGIECKAPILGLVYANEDAGDSTLS